SNRPGRSRPGATGLPVPGYEAIVVDDEGRPVEQGDIGNLRVKGDSTMAYYWNKHEKTKEALYGSWIQTGDKYWQDADGFFWFAGRADDMLKVGGIWVSPVEVEATLIKHPAVLEAAVAVAAAGVAFSLLWEIGAPPVAPVALAPLVGAGVGWVLLRRSLRRRRVAAREFPQLWRRALERYVRYYMVLSPEDRARF